MKLNVYALFDSAVGAYDRPMFLRSRGEAIRSFALAANDKGDSNIARWPDQYTLFEIGTFDDSTGVIEMYSAHQSLGTALQYKDSPKATPLEAAIALAKKES